MTPSTTATCTLYDSVNVLPVSNIAIIELWHKRSRETYVLAVDHERIMEILERDGHRPANQY